MWENRRRSTKTKCRHGSEAMEHHHESGLRNGGVQEGKRARNVGKYNISIGRSTGMIVYVIYGKTGGSGEALAIVEALMEAMQLDIRANLGEECEPTLIMGNYNATPCNLATVKEMMQ